MVTLHKVKVEEFEGPLDLLLQLIEDQKLEITKVNLSEVTEQYIKILNKSAEHTVSIGQLADFLVVAARLLLIKSKALLPFLTWDEEDEGEELTKQLKIYKEYLDASKVIAKMIGKKNFSFSRQRLWLAEEIGFAPPQQLKSNDLHKIFQSILSGLEPFLALQSETIRKTIDIQEKIQSIREKIYKQATNFSDILKDAKDKTEVIVSFLALLELIKQKIVVVKQVGNFNDIRLEQAKEDGE